MPDYLTSFEPSAAISENALRLGDTSVPSELEQRVSNRAGRLQRRARYMTTASRGDCSRATFPSGSKAPRPTPRTRHGARLRASSDHQRIVEGESNGWLLWHQGRDMVRGYCRRHVNRRSLAPAASPNSPPPFVHANHAAAAFSGFRDT